MGYCLNIGGVPCDELHADSGKESFDLSPDNKALAATRVFKCDWGNRYALLAALNYTIHPSDLSVYAITFQMEPLGKPTGPNAWEHAKVTVGYKNLPFNPQDKKEISVETSAENVGFQNDGVEWEQGGTPAQKRVDLDPQVFIIFTQINVTIHNATGVNEPLWDSVVNCVNSGAYAVSGAPGFKTWEAGTLLYQGYSFTQKTTTGNQVSYEVTHKFLGSQVDHRKEWNPHIGDWDKVKAKQTGNYKYDEADFSSLGI